MRQGKMEQQQRLLEQYAWCNKRAPTRSEARLWAALSGRKLGVAFRRQVPIAKRYIADFLAPAVKLVVEVDGEYHTRQGRADARRDAALCALGYRVLRIEAELVMRDLPAAVALIRVAL